MAAFVVSGPEFYDKYKEVQMSVPNLVVRAQIGSTTGVPSISNSISKIYPAGQSITQSLLLSAAGNVGSQFSAPVGFSQITVDTASPVQLTAQRGTNQSYINQLVNSLTLIDDTVDYFQVTNNSNVPVTVELTFIVNVPVTQPVPGVVTSVNGMTGAVVVSATNVSGLATVAQTGNFYDLLNRPALATVASTGSWFDLLNRPTIPEAPTNADWNAISGLAQILNKPQLSTVAVSGKYEDLTNRPVFAVVATSGSYEDLSNRPALAAVATSGSYADLTDRPVFAAVATSGSYLDLSNTPSAYVLPTATDTVLGGIKVGNGLTADVNGLTGLVPATESQLGGVKAGTNITVGPDGTISALVPGAVIRRIDGYLYSLTTGQPIVEYLTTDNVVLPLNLNGSLATCVVAPTTQVTLQVLQLSLDRTQSSSLGTLTFNIGSHVGTFSAAAATVSAGQIIEVQPPSVFDPALKGVSVVILGQAQ